MLLKSSISGVKMWSDEWYVRKLGKMTSSKIVAICGDKGLGTGGMNYIREKVGEEMTGETSDKDFDNDNLRWGIHYEGETVNKFGLLKGFSFIIVQQLILDPNGRFGGTPDGLIILGETPDGMGYNVETLEVKCPPTFSAYLALFECETPLDVKKAEPKYYYQVLHQMRIAGALRGWFVVYHPKFKVANMKIIEFKLNQPFINKDGKTYFPISDDYKTLMTREALAEQEFDRLRDKLLKAGRV